MTPTALSNPIYSDEAKALAHFEAIRWPSGPVCFHCGCTENVRPLNGASMGLGWYYCEDCQDKFTARMGTVLERSHVPVHKWLLAMRLMASSKKGISAHQLHRTLHVTYKTAWFLAHRIREAMKDDGSTGPLGGEGKVIEADEMYHGPKSGKQGTGGKSKVLTLVERGGKARSLKMEKIDRHTVGAVLKENAKPESRLHTDEASFYFGPGLDFAKHETVKHGASEYARDDVTTNTVEGFFSIFKRGMVGTYQHCGEQHLQRYLHEFDFRYSNRAKLGVDDAERTTRTIKGTAGKRLTYRRIDKRPQTQEAPDA